MPMCINHFQVHVATLNLKKNIHVDIQFTRIQDCYLGLWAGDFPSYFELDPQLLSWKNNTLHVLQQLQSANISDDLISNAQCILEKLIQLHKEEKVFFLTRIVSCILFYGS